MLGVDSLIALFVCEFAFAVHVVGQCQAAIDSGVDEFIPSDVAVAFIIYAFHYTRSIPHLHGAADFHLLAGAHHTLPHQLLYQPCAHQLNAAVVAEITGGHDLGVVEHKVVAGLHILEDIAEMAVLDKPGIAVHHKHAARGAVGQRAVGYQFLGQGVIKIYCAHVRSAVGGKKSRARHSHG